jgi:hypothetical protein
MENLLSLHHIGMRFVFTTASRQWRRWISALIAKCCAIFDAATINQNESRRSLARLNLGAHGS